MRSTVRLKFRYGIHGKIDDLSFRPKRSEMEKSLSVRAGDVSVRAGLACSLDMTRIDNRYFGRGSVTSNLMRRLPDRTSSIAFIKIRAAFRVSSKNASSRSRKSWLVAYGS